MSETLFAFDERNYLECQKAFRGAKNEEYYLGDYTIEAGSVIDVRAERKAVGACSIIRLRSRTRLSFRRSWSHIREDSTDVTVLWFVKRGRLCVSHQTGYSIAGAGEFAITKSMAPFFMECQPDDEGQHEVLHVIVPTHILRRFLPHDLNTGFTVAGARREFLIAEHILTDIFEDEGELADQISLMLFEAALSTLSHAVEASESCAPARQSLTDRRLQDVLRYIEIHLSDPKLSIAAVARGCGISPRYLSFLLKLHGTPFSALVWEQRLKTAALWIASSKSNEIAISEIAYRAGFKSPAHFSRMFKRVYTMTPREYRSTMKLEASAVRAELFAPGEDAIQQ